MHITRLAPLLIVALSACSSPEVFYKQGTTLNQVDGDQNTCDVQALRDVPINMQSRYIPPVYRTEKTCGTYGCSYRQVMVTPGRWEQYDANLYLRERASDQCMGAKGYSKIELPRCEEYSGKKVIVPGSSKQPILRENACAVKSNTGRWRAINPAVAPVE